jgi:hypothetical protein
MYGPDKQERYWNVSEMLPSVKHSGLLGPFVIYKENAMLWIWPLFYKSFMIVMTEANVIKLCMAISYKFL